MTTIPTNIVDKNGKATTVHKGTEKKAAVSTRSLPSPVPAEAIVSADSIAPHPFSADDYNRITTAYEEMTKFKEFVLDRFKVFAQVHEDMNVDEQVARGGGYVSFDVDEETLFNDRRQEIVIYKRETGMNYDDDSEKAYRLPQVFLFQSPKEEAEYESFINLKKKLFGTKP